MPIPLIAWIVGAALAGAVALRALAPAKPTPPGARFTLRPQYLSLKPRRVRATGSALAALQPKPQIPAEALAAVASKALYATAFDSMAPQMRGLANAGAAAERSRAGIVGALWKAISVGLDGVPYGKSGFERQHLRFNLIAIAVQDALNAVVALPISLLDWAPMRPSLQFPTIPIASLSAPSQWLCYRYMQLVEAIGCDDWDSIWVQGHTTRQIYTRYAPHAIGGNEQDCLAAQRDRRMWLYEQLERLFVDKGYAESQFLDILARRTLELGKKKIIIWPGGPASSPYVDWGWVVGWLVRAVGAAAKGDYEGIIELGDEAGAKSKQWAARPPGDDYGSAELAADLQAYAGDLASSS